MRTGRLIVFEGSEGAGKTTQLKLLETLLRAEGMAVSALREPGGTVLGNAIRSMLLDPARHICPEAEALLFMASRAQLVNDQIDPALQRGVVVLMDRFFLSTYAYQIDGRGLPEEKIRRANSLAVGSLVPDLTVVLGIAASEGMTRATARGEQDRIELLGDEFHERVEKAFTRFADSDWQRQYPEAGRVVAVDGRGTPDAVHRRVVGALAQNLPGEFENLLDRNQR